ncbi:hypothetical protein [Pseudoalteromonas sp. PB2-1]|uniref:hypothetical protein n=1 Tax=Pseudoalteromonas sp. PB2-1 TaxID=2907242 RepID=UPI00386B20CB
MSKEVVEQALEAFIAEARIAKLDIEKIAIEAKAGIMGNKIYSWISTTEKTQAVAALEKAIKEVSQLDC